VIGPDMAVAPFMACSRCGAVWKTREAFLSDGLLRVDGYRANLQAIETGLFFVTHEREGCGFTLTLAAREFLDLYGGPRYSARKTFSDECPRFCLDDRELQRCVVQCECAVVREVLDIVAHRLQAAQEAAARPRIKSRDEPPNQN
jgi:hypothetical protein